MQQRFSTCNAAMFRCKLKENVACITGRIYKPRFFQVSQNYFFIWILIKWFELDFGFRIARKATVASPGFGK